MDKIAYKYDAAGLYSGVETIQESPLEPGIWLWPPNVTELEPTPADGMISVFSGEEWIYVPEPEEPAEEQEEVDPRQDMIVSSFQAKAALLGAGLLDEVESYFAGDSATPVQKLAWKETSTFYRLSPLVIATGTLLGMTDSQLDDLFTEAAQIEI